MALGYIDERVKGQVRALDWLGEPRRIVVATLIEALGSAPFEVGAQMLIDEDGRIEGSVTGGCVEAALVGQAGEIFAGGAPRVVTYGISDDVAAGVGLMCGGTVRLLVSTIEEIHRETFTAVIDATGRGEPVAMAMSLDGESAGEALAVTTGRVTGPFSGPELLERSLVRDARGLLGAGTTEIRRYAADGRAVGGDRSFFVHVLASPPTMVIVGAVDYSAALAQLASEVGYKVTICDARSAFVASPRFASHAEVVIGWPDELLHSRELGPRDAVLVFTHDPKFDEPALIAALAGDAGYIGALGSRRTQAKRLERLRDAGMEKAELERIAGPCGLDVGAQTPAETAISILAEVLAIRSGREGGRLSRSDRPIHPEAAGRI